jgi:glycosyltransferase involved in cell wall biosynthesis
LLFSLIIPTIHRTLELARLLKSIAEQKLTGLDLSQIEAIIVDQNPDDRLLGVIEPYQGLFPIVRLTAPPLGQSNAKNMGMGILRGKYVAFPDDDCFFETDTLERAYQAFQSTENRYALFGRALEKESGRFLLEYPKDERAIIAPKDPSVFLGLQIAQFYTAPMVKAVGDFDIDLCSGGKWGSGEETDFAIRCLQQGFSILFKPDILVYHPLVTAETMEPKKLKKYSIGFGVLCRKQGLHGLLLRKTIKQLLGFAVFALLFNYKKARAHWTIATGRLEGFWLYRTQRDRGAA